MAAMSAMSRTRAAKQSAGGAGAPRAMPRGPQGWRVSYVGPVAPFRPRSQPEDMCQLQRTWGAWWTLVGGPSYPDWADDLGARPPCPSIEEVRGRLGSPKLVVGI
eukprot:1458443-Pyramimonas_sp.AAC.1